MKSIPMVKVLLFVSLLIGLFTFSIVNTHTVSANEHSQQENFNKVYKIAKKQLGKKYVYGSTGPKSFDCSGFVKYVYKHGVGKDLPRTAQSQYKSSKKVSKHHLKPGDLVFFGGNKRSIYHVGMYIGKGKMIDSQNRGVVRENVKAPWWHAVGYSRIMK
ncbi:hydrolase [Apilactobacillus micheneri]|uniref:C40 family peptidase n=1 Tax=Apilactobacillus micheneri TaxID=1899430 RepID=UPI0011297334|nr:NlpC/P60 family protein [Apilactobacillus micheneri]TPR42650.1 hydrolase [Apilactobacillus micheneri]